MELLCITPSRSLVIWLNDLYTGQHYCLMFGRSKIRLLFKHDKQINDYFVNIQMIIQQAVPKKRY